MTYPVREHADEQDGAIEGQIDQRSGQWTRLQLMEMVRSACGCGGPIPSGKLGWPHTSFSAET